MKNLFLVTKYEGFGKKDLMSIEGSKYILNISWEDLKNQVQKEKDRGRNSKKYKERNIRKNRCIE